MQPSYKLSIEMEISDDKIYNEISHFQRILTLTELLQQEIAKNPGLDPKVFQRKVDALAELIQEYAELLRGLRLKFPEVTE